MEIRQTYSHTQVDIGSWNNNRKVQPTSHGSIKPLTDSLQQIYFWNISSPLDTASSTNQEISFHKKHASHEIIISTKRGRKYVTIQISRIHISKMWIWISKFIFHHFLWTKFRPESQIHVIWMDNQHYPCSCVVWLIIFFIFFSKELSGVRGSC